MEYSKENVMTRKEYLKSKGKNKFNFTILKYVLLTVVIILLGVYVFKQLNVYNNVTKIANKVVEETALAKTTTMYFVSDSYTKDGKSSVMLYKAYDESRTKILGSEDFNTIRVVNNKLYGIADSKLYSIDLQSLEKKEIIDDKIRDYYIIDNKLYYSNNDGIYLLENDEKKQIVKGDIKQFQIEDKFIYVIMPSKTHKSIVRFNLNGKSKLDMTDKQIVSKMLVQNGKVYFINESDKNRLYVTDTKSTKIIIKNSILNNDNINFAIGNNDIYYINNSSDNTLCRYNLKSGKDEVIVKKNVSDIDLVQNTLYYRIKNNLGIFKLNVETGKKEQLTSARTDEYILIN